jgi:hypothetical protein
MKILIVILLFLSNLTAQTQADKPIDIVKVYEDVLEMGYESEQIYDVLIEEYAKRNDTIKVEYYKKLKG